MVCCHEHRTRKKRGDLPPSEKMSGQFRPADGSSDDSAPGFGGDGSDGQGDGTNTVGSFSPFNLASLGKKATSWAVGPLKWYQVLLILAAATLVIFWYTSRRSTKRNRFRMRRNRRRSTWQWKKYLPSTGLLSLILFVGLSVAFFWESIARFIPSFAVLFTILRWAVPSILIAVLSWWLLKELQREKEKLGKGG